MLNEISFSSVSSGITVFYIVLCISFITKLIKSYSPVPERAFASEDDKGTNLLVRNVLRERERESEREREREQMA